MPANGTSNEEWSIDQVLQYFGKDGTQKTEFLDAHGEAQIMEALGVARIHGLLGDDYSGLPQVRTDIFDAITTSVGSNGTLNTDHLVRKFGLDCMPGVLVAAPDPMIGYSPYQIGATGRSLVQTDLIPGLEGEWGTNRLQGVTGPDCMTEAGFEAVKLNRLDRTAILYKPTTRPL